MEDLQTGLHQADIIAFVGATDAGAARRFYEGNLGLRLIAAEPGALVFDVNGIMLRVSIVERFTPPPFTVLGWKVIDISASLEALSGNGIEFEHFEGLSQDERGVCTFDDGTRVAWFRDPAGNMLSISQFES